LLSIAAGSIRPSLHYQTTKFLEKELKVQIEKTSILLITEILDEEENTLFENFQQVIDSYIEILFKNKTNIIILCLINSPILKGSDCISVNIRKIQELCLTKLKDPQQFTLITS
jgi:hypothetical protein